MRTLQSKVLTKINEIAEANGFEVVQSANYANTGSLQIQRANSFESLVFITYMFDTEYMDLTMKHRGTYLVPNCQMGRTDNYVKWYLKNTAGDDIEEFFLKLKIAVGKEKQSLKITSARLARQANVGKAISIRGKTIRTSI